MFVGICVLVAIAFVLSRSPQGQTVVPGGNSGGAPAAEASVPEGTSTVDGGASYSSHASSAVVPAAATADKAVDNGPVIQVSPPAGSGSVATATTAER